MRMTSSPDTMPWSRSCASSGSAGCQRDGCRGVLGSRRSPPLISLAAFAGDRPNELWMTDITEYPTREGKVYCAVVLDAFWTQPVRAFVTVPKATLGDVPPAEFEQLHAASDDVDGPFSGDRSVALLSPRAADRLTTRRASTVHVSPLTLDAPVAPTRVRSGRANSDQETNGSGWPLRPTFRDILADSNIINNNQTSEEPHLTQSPWKPVGSMTTHTDIAMTKLNGTHHAVGSPGWLSSFRPGADGSAYPPGPEPTPTTGRRQLGHQSANRSGCSSSVRIRERNWAASAP